jgi:flavin-dependent dehydrogenase
MGNQMVTIPLPNSSMRLMMRASFDAYLLRHADAEIREGVAVRAVSEETDSVTVTTTRGERIAANYVVAADGANSIVARSLGLRRQKVLAGAIEIEANVPDAIRARFAENPFLIFGDIDVGYLWIFPKADHLSVGIGALHPRPGELQSVLQRVMQRYGISLDGVRHGHPLPIYTRREQVHTRRTFLVGDAAGLVDPFTGEGIRFAIHSGRMAAEAILAGDPQQYAQRLRRRVQRNHQYARLWTNLFFRAPRFFFEVGVRNPLLSRAMIQMLEDRFGYGRLILYLIGTFPMFLTTKKMNIDNFNREAHPLYRMNDL